MPEATQLDPPGTEADSYEDRAGDRADDRAGKYLIFRLEELHFGVRIGNLREVMEMPGITFVPLAPPCVAGVINLRGSVIPVIDLRRKFGLPPEPATAATCIVAIRVMVAFAEAIVGVIVDEVLEVLTIEAEMIEDAPVPEDGVSYLLGTAMVDGKRRLLLDVDEVLNNLEIQPVGRLVHGG